MTVDTVRDLTGQAVSHRIHESLVVQRERLWWVAPTRRPFFTRGLTVHDPLRGVDLVAGDDYCVIHLDDEWSTRTQQELGHFLVILDGKVGSLLELTYQALGGSVLEDAPTIQELRDYISTSEGNPRWGEFVRREVVDPDIEAILELTKRVTFQHVVEETEAIRTAILYGDAEHHQEMMLYAVDTRTRYYNRILQLLQTARDAINAHAADKFGHQLHKDQIGLMEFPNYPVATQIVLEAGASSKHVLTPKGFSVMLSRFADGPLQEHYLEEPAHNLTPAQVGLSNIHNYPLANPTEAELGNKKDRYMTPGVTLDAMHYQFSSKLYAHQLDDDAHDVTPFQVGLGNYANYPLYDPKDFDAAPTIDNQYMTPKGVYDLILHHYWDDHLSHVYDEDNPHQLTTAQIGLGNVDNLSRDAYDALYSETGHHHTARTLPFTDGELRDWMDTAEWVLDSKITNKVPEFVWHNSWGKEGVKIVQFPNTQATKVVQQNTVIKAKNRQTGVIETKPGTVSLKIEQIDPIPASGLETTTIPWKTTILGDGATSNKNVPDFPEEAQDFTEVLMTSTDSALSTLSLVDVVGYITQVDTGGPVPATVLDEVGLRAEHFPDVPADTPVPVTLFFKYERPVAGSWRGRWQVDLNTVWAESNRLFPELNYHEHEVTTDLYYIMELPDRLKGPDGIFFREGGHYPYLRSGLTTKGDVGLGKLPDWRQGDFESRYAAKDHTHTGRGWISSSLMSNTYLRKDEFENVVRNIKFRVFSYIRFNAIEDNALIKNSNTSYRRLPEYLSPIPEIGDAAEYRDTQWIVIHDGRLIGNWTIENSGGHNQSIPCIANNTGEWVVKANHRIWSTPNRQTNDFSRQSASLTVDTGTPSNPISWVYDIYSGMLARGSNYYGFKLNNNGSVSWLDPTGPGYWMNVSGASTKKALQRLMALATIDSAHSGGKPEAGDIFGTKNPYRNSVSFMNSNYPGWDWNSWSRVDYGISDTDELAVKVIRDSLNAGNKNGSTVQYKNATMFLVDATADPHVFRIMVDKRTRKYSLYS